MLKPDELRFHVTGVITNHYECHPEAGTSCCVVLANSCAAGERGAVLNWLVERVRPAGSEQVAHSYR